MNWRGVMQRISKALMVPIVVLPVAALFMAAGELGLDFVNAAGTAIIVDYLPLLFAVGVAIGFTKYDGMAAFAAVVGHVVLTAVMSAINPGMTMPDGTIIPNEMSVLGGIMVGAYTAALYWRFKDIRFPEFLGLFSGKRFVPIITALVSVAVGFGFGHLWPPVNRVILSVGEWIFATGGWGVFVYGFLNRLLIPTGLHHILQNLILHVFGSFVTGEGRLVTGELARFMAGDTTAGFFSGGFFVTMLFALPAAALAIVHESRSENRKQVAGVMLTAALTSIVIGITEPAEFTFMFVAPLLFVIHALLTGSALLFSFLLGVRHYGYALPMFFLNLGKAGNPWLIFPLGIGYALVYYFVFRFVIRKFNYLTPGRETREEQQAVQAASGELADLAQGVIGALGGIANITHVDACMSRLRISVLNPDALDEARLQTLPAAGISRLDEQNLQIVLGTTSDQVAAIIQELIDAGALVSLVSPLDGEIISIKDFPDQVFADELLGIGLGIMPTGNLLTAPTAGEVIKVFPGGHALVMRTEGGMELLLHIGLDTVDLTGEGFEVICADGQRVEQGQPLVKFSAEKIRAAGKELHSAMIVTNKEIIGEYQLRGGGRVAKNREPVFVIVPKQ